MKIVFIILLSLIIHAQVCICIEKYKILIIMMEKQKYFGPYEPQRAIQYNKGGANRI